ncbi:TIGR03936 family radical SAM-associated protein [Chloroflexota bacterium]
MIKSLSPKAAIQRLRVKFGRGHELKYISHLDLMRLWERALRRAGIPVAYSAGFNPRPRLSFCSPLAVGVTSESELLDIFLEQQISPHHLTTNISKQLPDGVEIYEVQEIGLKVPSLQSQASMAEYNITVKIDKEPEEVRLAIDDFLALKNMQWQHIRDNKAKEYDIRALVENIEVLDNQNGEYSLVMRLKISARPEQVAAALGCNSHPDSIHRTNIILDANTSNV